MFEFDRYNHVLIFKCNDVKLAWEISTKIKELDVVFFDKTGYVEFNTNIGIESIDILDEDCNISLRNKVCSYLSNISELNVVVIS